MQTHLADPRRRDAIHTLLLPWYDSHRRDLPWRRTSDPYATWVSEIMLQQTRVEAVRPYFERWMTRFPTVQALAAAPLDAVLLAWQGLGYYSRARNLHRGAAWVVAHHAGALPADAQALREVPGIGPYTAGAIASIAFGQRAPLVDGNVERVLARLFALDDDPRGAAAQRARWALADALVHPERPGDWNQALMELGATVCVPRAARCGQCPLAPHCEALATDRVATLPATFAKKTPALEAWWAVALHDERGRLLVAKRPDRGLLASLWDVPMLAAQDDPATDWQAAAGTDIVAAELLEPFEHVFSHRRWLTTPVRAHPMSRPPDALPNYSELRWITPGERHDLPWSRLAQRVLAGLDRRHD